MKSLAKLLALAFALSLSFAITVANSAWAGGDAGLDDHPEDEGPYFFGFVKDTARKAIRDAKVTAESQRPAVHRRPHQRGWFLSHPRVRQRYSAEQRDHLLRQRGLQAN